MKFRDILDETLANGFSNPTYNKFVFYFHILAQCKIVEDESIETLGVRFNKTHFELSINKDFFSSLTLEHRIGVLIHEMMHIIFDHLGRFPFDDENIIHKLTNIATDCSINQLIGKEILPENAIFPKDIYDIIKEFNKIDIKDNETAEYYYNILIDNLPENIKNQLEEQNSNLEESQYGSKNKLDIDSLDNHKNWKKDEISEELKKQMVKKMISNSIERSRGNIPDELSSILEIWNQEAKVSWKKVLKNLTAKKKANKKTTILRRNRRFQNRPEIKGYTKDRKFIISVIIDISGSMNDEEIIKGLVEIKDIATKTSSEIKILQVDTEVYEVEDFNPKSKTFNRKGNGGTYLKPALEYMKDNKFNPDCIITITDGWIESLEEWQGYFNCPYMFLLVDNAKLEGLEYLKKTKVFDIKDI